MTVLDLQGIGKKKAHKNGLWALEIWPRRDGTINVSLARTDRLPSWEEVAKVKSEFIGDDMEAVHMVPTKKDHINLNIYCIHLWSPIGKISALPNLNDLVMENAI